MMNKTWQTIQAHAVMMASEDQNVSRGEIRMTSNTAFISLTAQMTANNHQTKIVHPAPIPIDLYYIPDMNNASLSLSR